MYGLTPINVKGGASTHYGGETAGQQSDYKAAFTPENNVYASPVYHSPYSYESPHYVGRQSPVSPTHDGAVYASPIAGYGRSSNEASYGNDRSSPVNIYASPIYQAQGGGKFGSPIYASPTRHGLQSPIYSP